MSAELSPADQALIRLQERERSQREVLEQVPDIRISQLQAPAQRVPEAESPCFPVTELKLEGAGADDFQWAILAMDGGDDPLQGRCLGARGINLLMGRIQNVIIARGFITTRMLATSQDLKSGILRLSVIPGRIHAIRFEGEDTTRVTGWNALPMGPGDLLNLRDVELALEKLKRAPSAEVGICILPAEGEDVRPGESDLAIHWRQGTGTFDAMPAQEEGAGQGTARSRLDRAEIRLDHPFSWAGQRLRYSGLW